MARGPPRLGRREGTMTRLLVSITQTSGFRGAETPGGVGKHVTVRLDDQGALTPLEVEKGTRPSRSKRTTRCRWRASGGQSSSGPAGRDRSGDGEQRLEAITRGQGAGRAVSGGHC